MACHNWFRFASWQDYIQSFNIHHHHPGGGSEALVQNIIGKVRDAPLFLNHLCFAHIPSYVHPADAKVLYKLFCLGINDVHWQDHHPSRRWAEQPSKACLHRPAAGLKLRWDSLILEIFLREWSNLHTFAWLLPVQKVTVCFLPTLPPPGWWWCHDWM